MTDRPAQTHYLGEAFINLYPETSGVHVSYDDAEESILVTVRFPHSATRYFTHQCDPDDDSYVFVGLTAVHILDFEPDLHEAASYSGGDEY